MGRKPQGASKELRVEEEGESEGRSVTERIGVEASPTLSHAKAGRLPSGLYSRESLRNGLEETRQMTVEQTTGAVSHQEMSWYDIDWQKAHKEVRRLQKSDGKQRQKNTRSRRCRVEHTTEEVASSKRFAPTRISSSTATADIHSQNQ